MKKFKKEIEFNDIISDIIRNKKFIELKYEDHHGISRLDHSINVAKVTYRIAKKLKLKSIKEVTRAALLHDLFLNSELEGKINFVSHPLVASLNAQKEFKLNKRQINAIEAHMYPMSKVFPKYKESWLVTLSDKTVAIYEMLRYKAPLKAGTFLFFIMNFMTIPVYSK